MILQNRRHSESDSQHRLLSRYRSVSSSARGIAVVVGLLFSIILVAFVTHGVHAQQRTAPREYDEYQVKATYIYRIASYVTWPGHGAAAERLPTNAITIGIVGQDPFGDYLNRISTARLIHDKQIIIKHIRSIDQYSPCHILFVPSGEDPSLVAEILKRAKQTPTLTIGESPGFAENGGIINFFIVNNKVKFEINPDAANDVDLKLNAKLLQTGRIVRGN